MSDPRFQVTIRDRQTNQVQRYDIEHIVAALCLPHGGGEAWMVSLRGVSAEQAARAVAVLIDRMVEIMGEDVIQLISENLGATPLQAGIIDYAAQREGQGLPTKGES